MIKISASSRAAFARESLPAAFIGQVIDKQIEVVNE